MRLSFNTPAACSGVVYQIPCFYLLQSETVGYFYQEDHMRMYLENFAHIPAKGIIPFIFVPVLGERPYQINGRTR